MERNTLIKAMDLNISVLDDDQVMLRVMRTYLDFCRQYNYKLFKDPEEFLNISTGHTDIAIIDHQLGNGVTGLEIVERLLRRNKDCFIIVVSGEGSENVVADYMNADCDRYVIKGHPEFRELFIKYLQQGIEKMVRFKKLKALEKLD